MAQKSLHKFSIPAIANMPTGPAVNIGDKNFELCTGLIMMVQASLFCRLPSEAANTHPQYQGGNSNFNSNYNSNQPSLKDLVLGQAKINENLAKKLIFNDKMLENINSKIEGLNFSVKNQLSFNKMIETQLA
jgi:hypothetical protein